MTITGNVKFFDGNRIDADTSVTFTSANTNLIDYLYDNDRNTKLTSVGSNDATPEVWNIIFPSSVTIDRILVDNHNIKSGDLKYYNGVSFVNFSAAISWSASTDTTNYYEFDSVSTTEVRLTMNTTQVANAQKYVGSLLVFAEIGTLSVNPSSIEQSFEEKFISHKGARGGSVYVLFGKKYSCEMILSDASETDVSLINTLKDNGSSFYVYPGGGVDNDEVGYRLEDIYLVNYTNPFAPNLKGNLLGIGMEIQINLEEV